MYHAFQLLDHDSLVVLQITFTVSCPLLLLFLLALIVVDRVTVGSS